ncbi:hypothetical protein [Methylobacter marinus]|uniref:hypothetical protein n=1 Tax=Methylobacter marinus TaxID=34058 RepID=UPI0003721FC1|nr:hypothetical protein [Methylobacter marinus]
MAEPADESRDDELDRDILNLGNRASAYCDKDKLLPQQKMRFKLEDYFNFDNRNNWA